MATFTSIQLGEPTPDGFPPAVLKALRQAIAWASANTNGATRILSHGWSQQKFLPLALKFLKKELGVVDPPTAPSSKRKRAPKKKSSSSEEDSGNSEEPESDLTDLESEEEDPSDPEPGPSSINKAFTSNSHQSNSNFSENHTRPTSTQRIQRSVRSSTRWIRSHRNSETGVQKTHRRDGGDALRSRGIDWER